MAETFLTATYFANGQSDKGQNQIQHLQREIDQSLHIPISDKYFVQAVILRLTHDKTGARKLLAKLLRDENEADKKGRRKTNIILYIILEDFDSAFKLIGKLIETRDWSILDLKANYFLKELRTDSRYPAMLKKIGLEP